MVPSSAPTHQEVSRGTSLHTVFLFSQCVCVYTVIMYSVISDEDNNENANDSNEEY